MYEKISEEEARLVKVRKVKNKILSEIDNRICSYKNYLQSMKRQQRKIITFYQ